MNIQSIWKKPEIFKEFLFYLLENQGFPRKIVSVFKEIFGILLLNLNFIFFFKTLFL